MTNSPWIWVALKLFPEYVWIWCVQIRRQGRHLCPMQSLRDMGSDHVPPWESSIFFLNPSQDTGQGRVGSIGQGFSWLFPEGSMNSVTWSHSRNSWKCSLCIHKDALMDSLLACKCSMNGVKSGRSDSRASVNSTWMGGHPRWSSVYWAKDECGATSYLISRRHKCLLSLSHPWL